MNKEKPVVLLGPICDDPAESVSGVNQSLANGLKDSFTFVCSRANRRHGQTLQSRFNFWNTFYLVKHVLIWCFNLVAIRPQIAHYAISSGWAMEKGLLLLCLARGCGAHTVGHLHSGGFIEHWKSISPLRRSLAAWQLEKLDAFIVLSESWKSTMQVEVGIPSEKIHVVNNPIATDFENDAMALPVERPGARLLSLGIMGRDKGVFELVSACSEIIAREGDLILDIVGPEREPGIRDAVLNKASALGLAAQIRLPGMAQGAAKLKFFENASIFVFPSHYENFPLVVIEAAAAGLAIITTRVGAVPEFFKDGVSAAFVDTGDAGQLADAIIRLMRNPTERRILARGAREVFVNRLSKDGIVESLKNTYEAVLGADPGMDVLLHDRGNRGDATPEVSGS